MNTNQNDRHVDEIVKEMVSAINIHIETTEECIDNCNQPDYVTDLLRQDIKFLKRIKEDYLSAMQRAVEETASLRTELERVRGEYKIQRLTHQLFCGKVADQLGFERTVSLMKQSKEEITCGLEGGGDGK
jgi:hypothetical protein